MKLVCTAITVATVIASGLGCSSTDKGGVAGPNGMSVDSKGNIHDNHGNTYTAPESTIAEKDFPVPFYPSSTADGDATSTQMPGGKRNVISNRITTDPVSKVVDFYKEKVPSAQTTGGGDHIIISGKFPNGDEVTIPINKEDRGTTIGITAVVQA